MPDHSLDFSNCYQGVVNVFIECIFVQKKYRKRGFGTVLYCSCFKSRHLFTMNPQRQSTDLPNDVAIFPLRMTEF